MQGLLMNAKPAPLHRRVGRVLQDWFSAWAARQAAAEIFQRRVDTRTGDRLQRPGLRHYY